MFQFPANPLVGDIFTPLSGTSYRWNGTGWILLREGAALLPSGIVMPYAGTVISGVPEGWLLCDGSSQLVADYPALSAALAFIYGGGGLNFNLPDLRGRVVLGRDDMGGTEAGRITVGVSGINGTILGAAGGAQSVALTTPNLPAHAHGITDALHSHTVSDPSHTHSTIAHTHTDTGHAHGTSDTTHSHGATSAPHAHALNPVNSRVLDAASDGSGGLFFDSQADRMLQATATVDPATVSVTVAPQSLGLVVASSAANLTSNEIGVNYSPTGLTVNAALSGLSATTAAGGGTAHVNVQPALVMNYIIKT